jgi:hypothetical protein
MPSGLFRDPFFGTGDQVWKQSWARPLHVAERAAGAHLVSTPDRPAGSRWGLTIPALRLINLKRYADARKTMEQYMELFSENDFMRELLRKVEDTTSSSRK